MTLDDMVREFAQACGLYTSKDAPDTYLNGTEEDAPVITHNELKDIFIETFTAWSGGDPTSKQ